MASTPLHGERRRIDGAGEAREIEPVARLSDAVALLDPEILDIGRGAVLNRAEGQRLGRAAAIGDVEPEPVAVDQPAIDGAVRRSGRLSRRLGQRGGRRQQGSNEGSPEHAAG
jgi:hypothetical protein